MMVQSEDNLMLDYVLDSPLMLTKLQAAMQSHSGPYFNDHHQAASADHGNMCLQYDDVPILCRQQALFCHPIGHTPFAFSSSMSSASVAGIVEEADCHLLANPKVTSSYKQSYEQEQEGQQEADEAAMLVSSNLSTISSSQLILGPGNNIYHNDLNSSYLHSHSAASHCAIACGLTSPHDILLGNVQHDPCLSLASDNNVAFLHEHLQDEEHSSLIARDLQSSCTNASSCRYNHMRNGGGIYNPHMAALATSSTSSSSASTPSNMTVSGQVTDKLASWGILKTAWMGYGAASSTLNGKQSDVGMVDVDTKYKLGRGCSVSAMSSNVSAGGAGQKLMKKKRRKRKTKCSYKNVEEMETQRMTHIAVERNRRKQMNDHLRALRLLMPESYIQRGDQASVVGATIRFVAEMEQVVQCLKLQNHLKTHHIESYGGPQTREMLQEVDAHEADTYARLANASVASVEVTLLTTNTFLIKITAQKNPHQLLHTLLALSKLPLRMTRLTVTTIGLATKIYTFNLEMDNGDFQILTPQELAVLIEHMLCVEKTLKPIED